MLMTGQAISPTSNVHFIIDSFADYVKDNVNPFATMLERSNLSEAIHQLLRGLVKFSDESQTAIARCFEQRISRWQLETDRLPQQTVKVHHAFSDILGETASLVSRAVI